MVNRIIHRLDFFHRFVAPSKHKAYMALNGPCLLNLIITEQLNRLLEVGGGQVLHQHEPLDAGGPLLGGRRGDGRLLVLENGEVQLLGKEFDGDRGVLWIPSFIVGFPTL